MLPSYVEFVIQVSCYIQLKTFFEIQVGLACVQIAKSRGLHVLGTAGSEAGIDLILRNGCDAAFSHREDGYAAKIMVP